MGEDKPRRDLDFDSAKITLYPDDTSDKKDLIKMDFNIKIPPVPADDADVVAGEIQDDLRQCFNDTDAPQITDGAITDQFVGKFNPCDDPFTNDCHALAVCTGSAITESYNCTCVDSTDGDPDNAGRDCRVLAVAG